MNDNSKASWHSFMWSADDFFITYALTCEFSVHSVIMFVLGHSIELYLKAVYTFQTNDIQKAIKFSHDIKGLFKACQKEDPKFMPDFTFKANKTKLHYIQHQEFYIIAEHLPNLKYLGTPKKNKKELSFGFITHNDYWINFVKTIRCYLNYPGEAYLDPIKVCLDENENLPERTRIYLNKIYI